MTKKIIVIVSIFVIFVAGVIAALYAYKNVDIPYEGNTNVLDLIDDANNYNNEDAQGIADIIVNENLDKTMAANNVAAVVFDYRGYDTLGEAFILVTAIAGTFVILAVHKKKDKKEDKS